MGTELDARIAFEARFASMFIGAGAVPIHFWSANLPHKPVPGQAWVAFSISEGEASQITVSPPLHRFYGQVIVQIFVPEDKGAKQSDDIVDLVGPIFRRAQFSYNTSGTITCRTPTKKTVGVRDGWFQVNVSTSYHRDAYL